MIAPMMRTAQLPSVRPYLASRTRGFPVNRALGTLVVGLLLARTAGAQPPSEQDDAGLNEAAQAAADLELLSTLDRVVGRAIDRAERSVVSIARRSRAQAIAQGREDTRPPFPPGKPSPLATDDPRSPDFVANEWATGIVIDRSGLVLTVSHILGDSPREDDFVIVTVDRKVFHMTVRGSDARSDLAVLALRPSQPRGEDDFIPAVLGDTATLRKGQTVVTLGNPYGIARDGEASASRGIVSNLRRKAGSAPMPADEKTLHHFGTLIQTDAKLNFGTSGGALINLRGEIVGLTVSQAAGAGYEQAAGYAIPIDQAFLRIIERLRRGEEVEYGLLGITGGAGHLASVKGVPVNSMISDGPAARAGLQMDDVITEIDGEPVADFDELCMRIGTLPPETAVRLTLSRAGQVLRKRVVIAKYPLKLPQIVTERPPAWRGLRVDYKSTLVESGAMSLPLTGVAAREVSESSAAWNAGLRPGAVITHVADLPVDTPADFRQAIAEQAGPVRLSVAGERGATQTVTVPSEE